MVFQGSLVGVSMKYQGCFMQLSWIRSFKGVSRKFQESFDEDESLECVTRMISECFMGVLEVFHRSLKGFSRKLFQR